jgi:ABC-type nitrate/sulfonate/bicarbonate transport system substrate-binding protein
MVQVRHHAQPRQVTMHPERQSSTLPRLIAALALFLAMASYVRGQPLETVGVGALRFSSSGPLFLAKDRGYFEDERLNADIVFFEAAPTIATAVASGDLTFGVTALTAALSNLAAHGQSKLIAGQAREQKGHPGNMILVTRRLEEEELTWERKIREGKAGRK